MKYNLSISRDPEIINITYWLLGYLSLITLITLLTSLFLFDALLLEFEHGSWTSILNEPVNSFLVILESICENVIKLFNVELYFFIETPIYSE